MSSSEFELPVRIPVITVSVTRYGTHVVVQVSGEIDLSTRGEFEQHLDQAVRSVPPSSALIVDLRGVEFLGSSGLAALLVTHNAAEERGVALRLVGTQRAVRRPVEVAGLSQALGLYDTVESALEASSVDDL